jgi:hypothetical protein
MCEAHFLVSSIRMYNIWQSDIRWSHIFRLCEKIHILV